MHASAHVYTSTILINGKVGDFEGWSEVGVFVNECFQWWIEIEDGEIRVFDGCEALRKWM